MNLTEKLLEYNYTFELFRTAVQSQMQLNSELKAKPFDLPIQSELRKIEHDLPLLKNRVKELGVELNIEIEKRCCTPGVRFQFVPTKEESF